MYADEIAGGALYRGLAEYADDDRRTVFLQLADAEERHAEHWARLLRAAGVKAKPTAHAVPRPRAVLPRSPLRHRSGAPDHVAHRSGRGRPLPRRRRSHQHDGAAGSRGRSHHRGDAGHPRGWTHRAVGRPSPRRGRRHAARHRVRRERRPRVELLAGDGRVGRHARQQHRGARRHRRAGRRRVLDGVGRVDLGALAARALRERAAHRVGRARRVPRGGARRARADLPRQGRHARGRARRSSTRSWSRTTSRSTRSPARSSASTRASSGRRGSPRSRRSSRSRSARCCRSSRSSSAAARRPSWRRRSLSVAALFAVGAATSVFTGRHAGRAGLRMALIGAVVADQSPTASAPPSAPRVYARLSPTMTVSSPR